MKSEPVDNERLRQHAIDLAKLARAMPDNEAVQLRAAAARKAFEDAEAASRRRLQDSSQQAIVEGE